MEPNLDCKYYLGEKPCKYKCLCFDCHHYSPMGIRILILKLGAMGDALRTTPVLHAIKRKFSNTFITWVTDLESYPVLVDNPYIDRLLLNSPQYTIPLLSQEFDWVICLDKDPSVTSLAMQVNGNLRHGFAMSPYGTIDIFNEASRYSLALGLDDNLKFYENKKTYQEIIYEMIELPYIRDEYIFNLKKEDYYLAEKIVSAFHLKGKGPRIGFNTGCGDVFATKKWPDTHFEDLARLLHKKFDARIYLLGGKTEENSNKEIERNLSGIAAATGANKLGIFAGVIKKMDFLVTSDTMALHLGLAVRTNVVGLFGPTCYQEIDFYDRGKPVIISSECSPCYRKSCKYEESCMSNLKPETVFHTLENLINRDI
ncbi:glycosyltransferase family 9 protein [bacterium]|nr:glycosyltransferase family 9 protein [bacterium]